MVPIESKLWVYNVGPLYETPSKESLPLRNTKLVSCKSGASSRITFLCRYHHKGRDALSAGCYTQEILGEAAETSQPHAFKDIPAAQAWNREDVYKEENSDDIAFVNSLQPRLPLVSEKDVYKHGGVVHTNSFTSDMLTETTPREIHLRLDALDMQRDFRGRPLRPLLDVDTPRRPTRSKPGKRQNVPPNARRMIIGLRDLPVEKFPSALKKFKSLGPERADWLYVLRYFRERENKSMLLEVFKFVLVQPAFKASARDYTNLMRVFVQLKDHEAVERTMQVMLEREVFPDLVTFTVVIGMYGKLGKFDMVKSKFDELKLYKLVPDTITYCAVIEAYCQLGYAMEAEFFLEAMERTDLPLKVEIFISLIRGYGNIGQVEDAERVFQLMQAKLLYPERRSYSALMDAYTKDEDIVHAIQVFNNMVAVGIEPTDKALARLLTACEKKNMLREAMEIVEKLESKSFKFGTNMLITFRGWLAKLRLEKEVEQMSLEVEKRLERKAYAAKKWSTKAYLPASYCL